jgi:4-amino-4-deoxy-L-arabinose transferase-like glycosyltransferase
MLGVLLTLVVVAGCAGVGSAIVRRWTEGLDPALRLGVGGLVGLGLLGTLTLFVGLIPGGLHWGVYGAGAFGAAGLFLLIRSGRDLGLSLPRGAGILGLLVLFVLFLFGLCAVLAPSDADDWDTLAYHLAVPKLWLSEGHIFSVPFISHSNFPDVIDDLYVWGLTWGGQHGAKAFSLGYFLLGILAIFGFARRHYGASAGWLAAVAFASVPAILWEAGTAYIDVGHGLYAGLGIAFAALALQNEDRRKDYLILSGVLLGFAAASKYTGLQTIFLVAFVFLLFGLRGAHRAGALKGALLVGILAAAIASPWYIKNVVNVGNPVYPFLYERFGGANWDQRRADIYRNEQQSFGVGLSEGKRDPAQIGHAVLGLAYQPGRYVNPLQTVGGGSPLGAVGVAVLAALVLWALSGRVRRFEGFVLAVAGLSFVPWFFLSQQSRYIVAIAPAAAILLGGAAVTLGLVFGRVAIAVAVLQSLYSIWLFREAKFKFQSQVVVGRVSPEEYQTKGIPFYGPSRTINREVAGGKVALYDEVFGYLLDVPYFWANAGHTTTIPYDSMRDADDYVREMKRLGFTHAYINLSPAVKPPDFAQPWLASMGLNAAPVPMSPAQREAALNDWQQKWTILLADAVAQRKLIRVAGFRNGILFRFQ